MDKTSILNKIESQLLSAFLKYTVPFLDKKIKTKKEDNRTSNLENIVVNSKPKVSLKDLKELERLLLKNLDDNVNSNKKIDEEAINYSISFVKQKDKSDKRISFSILYEENESEERLSISVKKDGKSVYSAETTNKKDAKDLVIPYKVSISYENSYSEERLSVSYKQQLKSYMQQHIESREDMSLRVPLKWVNILPESVMGGVLGFTYLGDTSMGRRADLTGKTARMVDIHESIHTPDEYETRVLTDWIMEKVNLRYKK